MTTDGTTDATPLLSRTGIVSPIGTLTHELKTHVDNETAEAFRRLCSDAGTDNAGALRNYVCHVVHGKTFDQLVHEAAQRRRLALMPQGPIEALIGANA